MRWFLCAENIKSKNLTQADKNITALLISWQKNDTFLSVIVGDEALIEPQKSIVSIYYCLLDKNYDSCLQGIRECQGYIREICDQQPCDKTASRFFSSGYIL